jgi:hypothetical protein
MKLSPFQLMCFLYLLWLLFLAQNLGQSLE